MHYLYRITNQFDGKIYIGQTVDDKKRWGAHKSYAKQVAPVQYIHRAMIKYGIDNFIYEVICICRTQGDANATEELLIKQYDSQNSEKGYNIKPGGNNSSPSEKTKKKMSDAAKIRCIIYPNTIPSFWFGKQRSNETKEKISKTNIGKRHSKETIEKMLSSAKNGTKSHLAKLSDNDVLEIRSKYILLKCGYGKLAKEYEVSRSSIMRIIKRITWKHI